MAPPWAQVRASYQPEPLGPRSAIGQRFPEAAINLARGEKLDSLNFRKRPRGFYQCKQLRRVGTSIRATPQL